MPAVVIVSKVSQGGQKIEPFSQIGKRINGSKWEGMVFQMIHPKFGERKKNISENRGNYSGEEKNKSQSGTKIENIQQTGLSPAVESRSSYFCPVCQRLQKQTPVTDKCAARVG